MRKFGRLSVLLVVVGLCFVGSVYAGLSDGLVAYYPFNGNANDESGNGNDGIVNGATLIEDRFGNYNCAYDFDGKNDYIIVNHNSNFNTTQISFSVWVLADNPTASNQMLIHKDQPNNYAHDFHIKIHDETFKVQLQNGSNQSNPSGDISTGWNHYVFTSNGNITHKAYINGEYSFSCSINWNINGNIQSIEFASAEGSDYFFDGKIDDIRIYNRALSESEIQQLYNEQSCDCPDTCSQTELNAKYNEGYNNGVATCTGFTQADIDAAKNEGYANGKGVGFEEGMEYCKKNPSECGFDVPACDSCCSSIPSDNACVAINSDLSLIIPCAGLGEKQYSFNLLPYDNPDSPFGYFWQLDLNSFGIK